MKSQSRRHFFMVTEFSASPDLIFSQSFAQDSSYGYESHQESSQTMVKDPQLEAFQHCTLPMSITDPVCSLYDTDKLGCGICSILRLAEEKDLSVNHKWLDCPLCLRTLSSTFQVCGI